MRIQADSVLPFERERVFLAYRDHLRQFIGYLPDVRGIDVLSRDDEGALTRLHNVWHGGGEMPSVLVKLVGDDRLSWDDFATWDHDAWSVEWSIRTHLFSEGVTCRGKTSFVDLGMERTRMEVTGDIVIDVHRIKAIPSFVAQSIAKTLEAFIIRQIASNVTTVSDAITQFLDAKAA